MNTTQAPISLLRLANRFKSLSEEERRVLQKLLGSVVETAVDEAGLEIARDDELEQAVAGVGWLTPRERQILQFVVGGASNKVIGRHLNISPRTVEIHRSRVNAKLGAGSTAQLVRLALAAGVKPEHLSK